MVAPKFRFLFVVLMLAVIGPATVGCQMFGSRDAAQPTGATDEGSGGGSGSRGGESGSSCK